MMVEPKPPQKKDFGAGAAKTGQLRNTGQNRSFFLAAPESVHPRTKSLDNKKKKISAEIIKTSFTGKDLL